VRRRLPVRPRPAPGEVDAAGGDEDAVTSILDRLDDRPLLTIRKSTDAERKEKWSPLLRGRLRIPIPKYVVVTVEHQGKHMHICSVFGLPYGGNTRAEALFWAERFASKNDYRLIRPDGWGKVEAKLP
jgi:hypothetical protein